MVNERRVAFVARTAGLMFGLLLTMARVTGIVRVRGYDVRKHPAGQPLLVLYNHPSMAETVLVPALLFPQFLWNPARLPVSAAAAEYCRAWWFQLLGLHRVCVEVRRGSASSGRKEFVRMLRLLREGRIVAIAPGGGRERKGRKFLALNGTGGYEEVVAASREAYEAATQRYRGAVIRRHQEGAAGLIEAARVPCVLAAVRLGVPMEITVSPPMRFPLMERAEIRREVEQRMLRMLREGR